MTSIERMTAVLRGQIPDRVPFFPTIYIDHASHACGQAFEEALMDPSIGNDYVLGSACAVPRFTPPENLVAAKQAVIDHGEYAR